MRESWRGRICELRTNSVSVTNTHVHVSHFERTPDSPAVKGRRRDSPTSNAQHSMNEEPQMARMKTNCSSWRRKGGIGHRLDEHNSGQRNRALAFHELLRVFGVAGDQVVTFVLVKGPAALRVVDRERLPVLERSESSAPLRNHRVVANPNFGGLVIVFVAQAQRENLVAPVEEEMCVGVALRVCFVRPDELREQVAGAWFVVWHGGNVT